MQKTNQKEFRVEKAIKIKCHKLYVKWKQLDRWKRHGINEWSYPEPKPLEEKAKVELDLSNCSKERFKQCNKGWYVS